MRDLHYRKAYLFVGTTSVLTSLLYWVTSIITGNTYYDFLTWNLLLAWIPCLLASVICFMHFRLRKTTASKLVQVCIAGLWLLFFPNSSYIVTDLIHLTLKKSMYVASGEYTLEFWVHLVLLQLFAWNGLLLGFLSLYQLQSIVYRKGYRLLAWLFVTVVALLSGYGIWLGRVPRLNSWDVLTDGDRVLALIARSLSAQTSLFAVLFGILFFIVYITFYQLIHLAKETKQQASPSD